MLTVYSHSMLNEAQHRVLSQDPEIWELLQHPPKKYRFWARTLRAQLEAGEHLSDYQLEVLTRRVDEVEELRKKRSDRNIGDKRQNVFSQEYPSEWGWIVSRTRVDNPVAAMFLHKIREGTLTRQELRQLSYCAAHNGPPPQPLSLPPNVNPP